MKHIVPYICCLIATTLFMDVKTGMRSIHRKPDPGMAELRTCWVGDKQEHILRGYEFESQTLFGLFDKEHIEKNSLPTGPIPHRHDPDTLVDGTELATLIDELIAELRKAKTVKKEYKHFKVLKSNNFYARKTEGAIILKFKKHPFVVKLFFESPNSFVRPFFKDLEQNCLYTMGGGISRYLVGLTRIKNLEHIKARISQNPQWKDKLTYPRKWFLVPQNNRWFELVGRNVNGIPEQKVTLPSVYAIVADAIESERTFNMANSQDRHTVLSLTLWLDERLDPNISNFMIEKQTGKITFIDTEHFPTNLGMRQRLYYSSYLTWWTCMVQKYLKDNFGRTRRNRVAIREGKVRPIMKVPETISV